MRHLSKPQVLCATLLLFAFTASCVSRLPASEDERIKAAEIVEAANLSGGLIVHLGIGDGRMTAALHVNERYLVHGLDTDIARVQQARTYARSLELNGNQVSFDRFDGRHVPLVDGTVNLVVISGQTQVSEKELLRVLCPGGTAIQLQSPGSSVQSIHKPWPDEIDDWTHFLHGPDGNAVAQDSVVGFPNHLQWAGSPIHSRDHEFTTSMDVMVSAGGRLFYIFDEGSTAIPYYLPSRWSLVARDAFNGLVLWRHPMPEWRPYLVKGRTSLAADMWRRLVATDTAVYVTESIFGPVIALDPGTGKVLRRYKGTEKTEEIIYDNGVLYLVATTSPTESIDRRELAQRRSTPDAKRVMAVQADTGRILWAKQDDATVGLHPLTLAVQDNRLFFQNTAEVLCLDSQSGQAVWRYPRPSKYAMPGHTTPTLVVHDDVLLSADQVNRQAKRDAGPIPASGFELIAMSATDGRELWRCPCGDNVGAGVDVFVAGGLVWVGETPRRATSDYNHGRDLHTGEIVKSFDHEANWPTWHHHRCYRDKATEQFILAGRTGIEFADLETGDLITHHFVRGVCEYGILPCNGLIYSPPDQCACYAESKLHGFYALASKHQGWDDGGPQMARLDRGPAFGKHAASHPADAKVQLWATLRGDNARSGYVASPQLAPDVKPLWTAQLGGPLTALVQGSAGVVFVAQPETHTVFCLDGDNGKVRWNYQAGGRVDSPPSVSRGIVVFGCHDGWVYALREDDGQLVWRFRASPQDLRMVDHGQLASVWPVHGSVLIEDDCVYVAAGRNSSVDGGVYLYKLDLSSGKPLLEKNFSSRDSKTGEYVALFTPFDAELLPDREWPGLQPDVFSSDGEHLFLRSVPFNHDLEIQDKLYVRHLFGSMGFLEDTWWERSYWIFGSHFYGGARGHGYAKTLYPAGRLLTHDEDSVYGYLDPSLADQAAGIFRVSKNPDFIDLGEQLAGQAKSGARARKGKKKGDGKPLDAEKIRETYVWQDGIPRDAEAMQLSRGTLGDAIRRIRKYDYAWQQPVPLYPQAMLLTADRFWVAGPPKLQEEALTERLSTARTDRYALDPEMQNAVDTFAGRKGGVLCVYDKQDGSLISQAELPSSPVFDGLISGDNRLFVALRNGSVMCLGPQ